LPWSSTLAAAEVCHDARTALARRVPDPVVGVAEDALAIGLAPGGYLNYQLRKVTKARGHFPNDYAVVKLLGPAIINIEDKRARERLVRRQSTGKRSDQPARLVEGQRVTGWREALSELDLAYPGR
jgi:hypothetical protein